MSLITGHSPRRGALGTNAGKIRARIFCLVKDLGMDEETRKQVAGQCRADHEPSMRGMQAGELVDMERLLRGQLNQKRKAESREQKEVRAKRLKQHKRQDGPEGDYASEQARHFLKSQAVILWGPDEWLTELHSLIKKMTGYDYFWDMLTFPRIEHWEITRAVKDRILRAAKDQSSHGPNAEVNRRRRMRDEG